MKKSLITKHATTIILIAIMVLNIITYFMPYYKSTYSPTYGDKEVTNMYLYSGYFSVTPFTTMTLIIPILAIVFLLTDFKNGKPLSFALIASQFMSNILLILSTKSYLLDRQSNSYEYNLTYGYYMCIVMTILLALALICSITIYIIIERKNSAQPQSHTKQIDPPVIKKSNIDIFKERINTLNELKNDGVLNDDEYEQKRNEIVKELNI